MSFQLEQVQGVTFTQSPWQRFKSKTKVEN
jgi:hypothetical protein